MSNAAEQIPIYSALTTKPSNRHMTTFLNEIRWNRFRELVEAYPNATDKEMRAWASWINDITGRGDLPRRWAGVVNDLSLGLFSPRFAWSRVRTVPGFVAQLRNPTKRRLIARDLTKFTILTGGALSLANMRDDTEVNFTDPNKPDWLKIRSGNTLYDIAGGLLPAIRMTARVIGFGSRDIDLMEAAWRFSKYKAAPGLSLTTEIVQGLKDPELRTENIVHEPRNLVPGFGPNRELSGREVAENVAVRAMMPIFIEDILESYDDVGGSFELDTNELKKLFEGVRRVGPESFIGTGTQIIPKR